ncbi:MAG TPA: hypothetical protein VFO29_11840 [Candidatus Rubrimentiphilum sp.]|nr:hypothetical protein [Candidatus Rubrimentiphilum sp.]
MRLLDFQEIAATDLAGAALSWIAKCAEVGPPMYGSSRIPFLGQLRAITGSGKTPILASTVGRLGDSVVIWTSKSSPVIEQTLNNLKGKYRHLLPEDTNIVREIPSQRAWQELVNNKHGITIWLLTVASWNEAEAANLGGSDAARLSLHRPKADLTGKISPWEVLRRGIARPLWIVSDESHNQTSTQLDQLSALKPLGFLMASATPVQSDLFAKWAAALNEDTTWRDLYAKSTVKVRTADVVANHLLKTSLQLLDYNSGLEESLDGTLDSLRTVEAAADSCGVGVQPRAIYVVEKSNPPRGSNQEARPTAIWQYLRHRGIPADKIAVYTDTKELPDEAVRVNSLAHLHSRFKHIIFNQALQEGWDDPEAYVCYFDGTTKSSLRIRQIVGRILRQPHLQHYSDESLNTATVVIQTSTKYYNEVLNGLREELRLYAIDEEANFVPVKLRTRREPLEPISVRKGLKPPGLTKWYLQAPDMTETEQILSSAGNRPYNDADLQAPGTGRRDILSLKDSHEVHEFIDVLRSARTSNMLYLLRRMQMLNRNCANAVHPDRYSGPMFMQQSCYGSMAQKDLDEIATRIVGYYENHVELKEEIDAGQRRWIAGPYEPSSPNLISFRYSLHERYSRSDFNKDELEFAQTLDRIGVGTWMRNPTTGLAYSIPLPVKVERGSMTFFPDFLWWDKGECWAIDTTGRFLLNSKVRGKLLTISDPRIALFTRGKLNDLETGRLEHVDGWSLLLARQNQGPEILYDESLEDLLTRLVRESPSAEKQTGPHRP